MQLPSDRVQMQVSPAAGLSTYSFQCPQCKLMVVKPAGENVVGALLGAGVTLFALERPLELDEPKLGPPISHDDLLAFHFALQGDVPMDELRSRLPAT